MHRKFRGLRYFRLTGVGKHEGTSAVRTQTVGARLDNELPSRERRVTIYGDFCAVIGRP